MRASAYRGDEGYLVTLGKRVTIFHVVGVDGCDDGDLWRGQPRDRVRASSIPRPPQWPLGAVPRRGGPCPPAHGTGRRVAPQPSVCPSVVFRRLPCYGPIPARFPVRANRLGCRLPTGRGRDSRGRTRSRPGGNLPRAARSGPRSHCRRGP